MDDRGIYKLHVIGEYEKGKYLLSWFLNTETAHFDCEDKITGSNEYYEFIKWACENRPKGPLFILKNELDKLNEAFEQIENPTWELLMKEAFD